METVNGQTEVVRVGRHFVKVEDVPNTAGTTTHEMADVTGVPKYELPVGDLTPGANPTIPMPVPRKLTEGGENIAPPDGATHEATYDSMPARPAPIDAEYPAIRGVGSKHRPPPVWSGNSDGPNPPSSRGDLHPAMR